MFPVFGKALDSTGPHLLGPETATDPSEKHLNWQNSKTCLKQVILQFTTKIQVWVIFYNVLQSRL